MKITKQHEGLLHRVEGARSYVARIEGKHPEFLVAQARDAVTAAEAALATYVASQPVRTPDAAPSASAPERLVTGLFARSLSGRMQHLVADASRLEPVTVSGRTYLAGRYTAVCGRSYSAMWTTRAPQTRRDVCPHCLAKI